MSGGSTRFTPGATSSSGLSSSSMLTGAYQAFQGGLDEDSGSGRARRSDDALGRGRLNRDSLRPIDHPAERLGRRPLRAFSVLRRRARHTFRAIQPPMTTPAASTVDVAPSACRRTWSPTFVNS